ncbi:MAG: ATP-binding cassette domain-containing protein, partial [Pseudomonadota bacterium]
PRGSRLALVGPSGSGKTTLLNLLAGVAVADRGRVEVLGTDLSQMSGGGRDRFRGDRIGLIFQMFNLLPFSSVIDNILLPLSFSKIRRKAVGGAAAADAEARRLLRGLGLDPDRVATRPAAELSVGQQQRVAAARALIGGPELIIADEPTSALDPASRDDFLTLLFEEASRSGAAVLTVTHDEGVAARFSDSVAITSLTGGGAPRASAAPAAAGVPEAVG